MPISAASGAGYLAAVKIARAARLLDAHFPDPEIAAEALDRAVESSVRSGVPLVDVAYMDINGPTG